MKKAKRAKTGVLTLPWKQFEDGECGGNGGKERSGWRTCYPALFVNAELPHDSSYHAALTKDAHSTEPRCQVAIDARLSGQLADNNKIQYG